MLWKKPEPIGDDADDSTAEPREDAEGGMGRSWGASVKSSDCSRCGRTFRMLMILAVKVN